MPLYVPDASVLLKWVLPASGENQVDLALALLDAYRNGKVDMLLPGLWQYEVGNVLGLHYPDIARERLEALVRLSVPEVAPGPSTRALALELVAAHRVSFHDATYHALALDAGGVFLTADRRYHGKAVARGGVTLLSEWRGP